MRDWILCRFLPARSFPFCVQGPVAGMAEQEDVSFCELQITIGGGPKAYFLGGVWRESSFELELTDGRNVWLASASEQKVKKEMCPKGGDVSSFMKHVR
jgi:hypothetical protein